MGVVIRMYADKKYPLPVLHCTPGRKKNCPTNVFEHMGKVLKILTTPSLRLLCGGAGKLLWLWTCECFVILHGCHACFDCC